MISHRQSSSRSITVPRTLAPLHAGLSKTDTVARFQQAKEQIKSLRNEPSNRALDEKLSSKLCRPEQDASSFALLVEHIGFWPTSLMAAAVPQFAIRHPRFAHIPDLFQFLLEGEVHGASLLLGHDLGQSIGLGDVPPVLKALPLAETFEKYTSRLGVDQKRAACAAACAVVFPRWARIFHRLLMAVLDPTEPRSAALLRFFSTSVKQVDEMAAAIMMQEDLKTCTYQDMSNHVRLLQEYELLFWNARDVDLGAHEKPRRARSAVAVSA